MTVWVLITCDRHGDPEAHLYADSAAAVAAAESWAEETGCTLAGRVPDGWLYYAEHPTESDGCWVVPKEIIS